MNTTTKYLIGAFVGILLAFSVFSLYAFKEPEEVCEEPLVNTTKHTNGFNGSINIPNQVAIFDTIIPLSRYDLRERFDREMLLFVYQHSLTITTIKRANNYFPIIEPILKRYDVPNDFKYLALIESSFNVRAVSSSKAVGIWQFMPETARELGLEVNEYVDERYNVEKSTEAACRYFNRAYEKFGCWIAVAASYNAGMGGINLKLNRQEAASALDLLLPEETSRYIFRLFAAKELLKDPKKYGFILKKEDMYHTIRVTEYPVDTTITDLLDFAKRFDITYYQLKDFNVWLRNSILPNRNGKMYIIKIPYKEDLNFDVNKVIIYQKNWVQE